MSWQDVYRSRLTNAEAAVAGIGPGSTVFIGGNAATPRVLCKALAASAPERLVVAHVLLIGEDPFADLVRAGQVRHRSFFVGPADRPAITSGGADFVPCHLSDIPRMLREGRPRLDAALLSVAPPDRHGFLSLGVEVLASLAAAESARQVIVQVNPRMPRVHGNAAIHVSDVHAIVEAEEELATLEPCAPTAEERAIAGHIAPLIPEGATLQLGIGGVPDAVIGLLGGRDDLGVHSEMISDGVMRAVEAGTVTGRFKTRHRRKVVTTFALGSRVLYDWLHENGGVEAHPADHTNDLLVASGHDRLVSINGAISVDLGGQVNSDSIGRRIFSGVGGQLDFVRAAHRSRGGVSFLALPSTAKGGTVSRIVVSLAEGAGVVTPRADVRFVVTEHGVADLWGRSLAERAEALIAVADPRFQDTLRAATRP